MARPRLDRPKYRIGTNRSGTFEVKWTEGGRTRTVSTGTKDQLTAVAWCDRFIAGREAPQAIANATVKSVLDGYVQHKHDARSRHSLVNSAGQVAKLLGNIRPSEISQATIRRYAAERAANGIANGTIIKDLGVLRAALNWAVKEKIINPVIEFSMPVPKPPPKERWLTRAEASRLIDACTTPHLKLFVLIALSTGARREAISELTWDRVNLESGVLDFGDGHGNKRRPIVPVEGRCLGELRAAYQVRTTDHVLEWAGRPAGNIKIAFSKACKRANLEDVTPHVLRHTAATLMIEAGISTREVARHIGATEKMVEEVYGHHAPDYLRKSAKVLAF